MDLDIIQQKAYVIFNSGEQADARHKVVASLAGGNIASHTDVTVTEEDYGMVKVHLSQNGLFPQSVFDPMFNLRDWANRDSDVTVSNWGDGGRNETATFTFPLAKAQQFLDTAASSRPRQVSAKMAESMGIPPAILNGPTFG